VLNSVCSRVTVFAPAPVFASLSLIAIVESVAIALSFDIKSLSLHSSLTGSFLPFSAFLFIEDLSALSVDFIPFLLLRFQISFLLSGKAGEHRDHPIIEAVRLHFEPT
jgi:hypothetical protein